MKSVNLLVRTGGAMLLAAALLAVGGCTAILSETNDKPIESDPGRRSLGSTLDDQNIETTTTVNIRKTDPGLEHANVVVISYNGLVLLAGQVPDEGLRSAAAQTAANVKGVRAVHNYLVVGENTGFAVRSSDTLITTKVKSKLLSTANLKDSRVKVLTENGTVFLMGLVTHAEGNLASSGTQSVGGVQQVVALFEYVDG